MNRLIILLVINISLVCLSGCSAPEVQTSVADDTYRMLDEIREEKKEQLLSYLGAVRDRAESIGSDSLMTAFFPLKRDYYRLQREGEVPPALFNAIGELKAVVQQNYIKNYLLFYDILCIDNDGEIFYTIRKQTDYQKNIFSEKFEESSLSKKLRTSPDQAFVDYQYFEISGEPSAFFIQPVYNGSERIGWFVLQCSINKINNIFLRHERLGVTGEVILVNRDNYMLSDSRFNPAPSILKQKLSDENISSKFRERNGHKMVVDYRGCDVLTAFEVCTVFDSEWLIIAKINADEVITGHYEQYRESYQKLLMNSVNTADAKSCPPFDTDKRIIEVDMDEFCRAADKEVLFTRGVSTCTAVLISYPGRFSYLAHVSPFDRLYGENRTDLVGNMLRIINEFEVYPSEKQQLRFVVIAPSNQTVKNCVDMLVKEGYFLSQIKVLCNKDAQYANVFNDYENDRTVVQWKMAEEGLAFTSWDLADFKTVGEYARDNMSVPVN